ncbi:daunorubicin resistance protein DrrA family ABC transporter ATP-binding protein [Microbacterium laevaniformans]|uniref:Daunorubicin/doxorubicin resistance ATP-binding protein DrrA n=1 Tax=Microbacterium laevaniformans TaxID=36807 RepID=A0A150HIH3_9MICO|nr:ATP-binding cassette domain-containing protein [Microbacterium laevaniformans]KXZ61963.1 Daunorubicin/doxorubicin resistance ATP-binding protein DrrA [Microbacterium laevaniformans]MBM7753790.1 ABC-2 type transport system ATP-binding protein [Microbacterium laevaniformans]GLJ64346.1 daunorubicin resistance protein DrrA family ABC transporter ATP-binding protein [Microbacterium laevaniformans]
MPAIIETEGLTKSYRGVTALRGVDLELERGTVHALLGPNGAGKTTLVSILSTVLRPESGTARVAGYDIVRHPANVRGVIGLAGQHAAVEPKLTGRENLQVFGRLSGLGARAARTAADEALGRLGLEDVADRIAGTYSGGTRRRLDLAVSLVARPALILMDEPTTGLDPLSRRQLWDAVIDLTRQGTDVLLTTQYLEEADALAGNVIVIDGGEVVAHGSPAQLKSRVADETVTIAVDRPEHAILAAESAPDDARIGEDGMTVIWTSREGAREALGVFADLAARGIELRELTIRRPTLDDVFLDLVGTDKTESAR